MLTFDSVGVEDKAYESKCVCAELHMSSFFYQIDLGFVFSVFNISIINIIVCFKVPNISWF